MQKLGRHINEVWLIAPEDAKRILSKNYYKNRKIRNQKVKQYARDMANGKWGDSADPIIVTENGVLLNGQHRLTAVIESGVTIPFEVRIEPDDSIYKYLDNGAVRTIGDYVEMKNKSTTTAAANFIYCATYGKQCLSISFDGVVDYINHNKIRPTRNELIEFIESHLDGVVALAGKAREMYNATNCGSEKACAAFIWLVQMLNDIDASDEFIKDYASPVPFNKTIAFGRNSIQKAYTQMIRPTPLWMLSSLLTIYEAYVSGKDMQKLSRQNKYLDMYNDKLQEWRVARRKYNENDINV